jgi:uncharacterized protein (TIGR00299 family) protein
VNQPVRGQHLHFDPTSGIAGDMAVAALVDLGVPEAIVSESIAAMEVVGLHVTFETRRRGAYVAKGFVVHAPDVAEKDHSHRRGSATNAADVHHPDHAHDHPHDHDHHHDHDHVAAHAEGGHAHAHLPAPGSAREAPRRPRAGRGQRATRAARSSHRHRDYAEIRRLLRRAKLDPDVKALAEEIFARIAEVEAALHGTSVDEVAFHEVGAFDSIADVVGASAAIAWLAPGSIGSSPPVVGTGVVHTAHGPVPVPAPATAELLRGIPIRSEGIGELTTPTGAALLACVVDAFGAPPPLTLSAIGYGAGTRELTDRANVLRVMLGQPVGMPSETSADTAMLLQANIDDMSPQLLPSLMEALFTAGALDAWSSSIVMKKGRPAFEVSALVEGLRLDPVRKAFFMNSTTLGIRLSPVTRTTLSRSTTAVRTPWGEVRVKVAAWDGEPVNAQPEFDDCRRLAAAAGISVKRVWTTALSIASATTLESPAAAKKVPAPAAKSPPRRRASKR